MTGILKELLHIFEHPVLETLKMAPILFLAYLFMEWLEHAEEGKMARFVHKSRRFGPLFGSALGLVPQCGFSGAIASMYAAGTVTVGTLLAVFLTTSDEMLPMLISANFSASIILLILGIKLVIGLIVGFVADLIGRKKTIFIAGILCTIGFVLFASGINNLWNPYFIGGLCGLYQGCYWIGRDYMNIMMTEKVPTDIRASVVGAEGLLLIIGLAVGYLAMIVGMLFMPVWLACLIVALPCVIVSVIILILKVKESKGANLDEIEE